MPKTTAREESKFALPAEVALPAILNSVTEEEVPYTDKKTGEARTFRKWSWEFQIADGDYAGLRAWGETESFLSTHPNNKVRQFAEALLGGVEFEIGQDLDTDDLISLPCEIVVAHETYNKKDGTEGYKCPITQVFPAGTSYSPDEPPF